MKVPCRFRRPELRQLFEEITRLTAKFIRSPVLLLGSMTLFALLKLLTAPRDDTE